KRKPLSDPCWNANRHTVIRHIRNYHRTGTHRNAATDLNQLFYGSTDAHPAPLTDANTSSQAGSRADMHRILQYTIMIDGCSGIDDHTHADTAVHVNYCSGKKHRARADFSITAHYCRRMDQHRQLRALLKQGLQFGLADVIITNGHQHPVKLGQTIREQLGITLNRPSTIAGLGRPGIIKKTD